MKVRASVKKICRDCRIIRRNGQRPGDLQESAAQTATGIMIMIEMINVGRCHSRYSAIAEGG